MESDWKSEWEPMIQAIGQDFSTGEESAGADVIEKGAIRKFLEPLEFDSPLHYDEAVAKEYGYEDVIAPYSSLYSWTIPPYWSPGSERAFTSAERNAQPTYNPLSDTKSDLMPETTGFFATDIEMDYIKPIVVGDRLTKIGQVLLSCVPKETKVGCGAFMVWESKVVNQDNEEIAVIRMGTYSYQPHEAKK